MSTFEVDRRTLLGGMAGLATFGIGRAQAASPPALPSAPVTLNVVDVAGQLQLTQGAMDAFAKANPKLVSKITYSQAPAPELPGKIKAQQAANSVDIDLVLTGTDALSAGIDQGLWIPVVTDYASVLPKLQDIYRAWRLEDAGSGTESGGLRCVLPGGSDPGIHAGCGEDAAQDIARNCWHGPRRIPGASSMRVPPTLVPAAPSFRDCPIS